MTIEPADGVQDLFVEELIDHQLDRQSHLKITNAIPIVIGQGPGGQRIGPPVEFHAKKMPESLIEGIQFLVVAVLTLGNEIGDG